MDLLFFFLSGLLNDLGAAQAGAHLAGAAGRAAAANVLAAAASTEGHGLLCFLLKVGEWLVYKT